jgi:hypothetical protein
LALLTYLQSDLKDRRFVVRFDKNPASTAAASYEPLSDEMHLRPLRAGAIAQEVVDLVHEYAHVKQDRAGEARLIDQRVPVVFGKEADLRQEIEARQRETYFMRLLELAGVNMGPITSELFNAEVTAAHFVSEFETERTGDRKKKAAATASIRKTIEQNYAQQFKDNGTFGEYPIEITDDNRALLYASWTGKEAPADLGGVPDTVNSLADLQSHLHRTLMAYAGLPKLFLGPKKQIYDKAVFTVFFRQCRLIQFGINK